MTDEERRIVQMVKRYSDGGEVVVGDIDLGTLIGLVEDNKITVNNRRLRLTALGRSEINSG